MTMEAPVHVTVAPQRVKSVPGVTEHATRLASQRADGASRRDPPPVNRLPGDLVYRAAGNSGNSAQQLSGDGPPVKATSDLAHAAG
jgi:hypothetical protein